MNKDRIIVYIQKSENVIMMFQWNAVKSIIVFTEILKFSWNVDWFLTKMQSQRMINFCNTVVIKNFRILSHHTGLNVYWTRLAFYISFCIVIFGSRFFWSSRIVSLWEWSVKWSRAETRYDEIGNGTKSYFHDYITDYLILLRDICQQFTKFYLTQENIFHSHSEANILKALLWL